MREEGGSHPCLVCGTSWKGWVTPARGQQASGSSLSYRTSSRLRCRRPPEAQASSVDVIDSLIIRKAVTHGNL